MARRVAAVVSILIVVSCVFLLADDLLEGSIVSGLTLNVQTNGSMALDPLAVELDLNCSKCGWLFESYSQFQHWGWLFQGFRVTGACGIVGIQGDVLLGPAAGDFLYAQMIATLDFVGGGLDLYTAQLGAGVLEGPADGVAIRLEGEVSGIRVESITELGADLSSITIVHAGTGEEKTFTTDPTVPGGGLTGQRISVTGWPSGCAQIGVEIVFGCGGFRGVCVELEGLRLTGVDWLTFDLETTFNDGALGKTFAIVPELHFGQRSCVNLYSDLVAGSGFDFDGLDVYGLEVAYDWEGGSLRSVSLLDCCEYAITTPEYGSLLVSMADAASNGWDVYVGYWEMISFEVARAACCGDYRFGVYTYFDTSSVMLFDWAMTEAWAECPLGERLVTFGGLLITDAGLSQLTLGLGVTW